MDFKQRAKDLVAKMTVEEKVSQMRYNSPAIERLNIPAYNWWNECLHGVARQGTATVFPQAIGMASSFNENLMFEVANAISNEARAKYNEYKKFGDTLIYQGLTYWSPNINIFRDPRWGRGHETYGEDPILTAKMATQFIKGLQGEGKYRKLDATIKHFAVHSGPEKLRHGFNVNVSDKDLYETYLFAFKYCIENAKPSAVMSAYNRVNGEACSASKTLLKDILVDKFGFDGYVVSDCGAINDIHLNHKLTATPQESAALAVNNGCHLNCGEAFLSLYDAYELDLVTEETITECCEKLFEARFRLGMFDTDCEYDNISYDVVECEKHRNINLQMAEESIVLLKNDGILPIKNAKSIAVIGPNADDLTVLLGNYNGTPSRYTTLLRGIQDEFKGTTYYSRGCNLFTARTGVADNPEREALIIAEKADVVILCMGLNSTLEGEEGDGFNSDASGDKLTLSLPKPQLDLYNKIIALNKPTVFVNVSGSNVDLVDMNDKCNAVLQCFYPGAEGGKALANILFGKTSPSARLPVTFYRSTDDLPPFEDYSMENRTYKFYKGNPLYPFGYGLSYANITETWLDENTCKLTNNGGMDTKYSVLQYEYLPYKSLKNFKKVFIKVGETLTVKF